MEQNILVKIGGDISGLSQSLSQASSELQSMGSSMSDLGGSISKSFGAAFAAVGAGLGFAVFKAADFEAAMSNVKAISGVTGDDFDKLSAKARDMGASTSKTATESAEALGYMALAGWDTQQMLGGLEPILRLSEAGAIDLGRASDLVTDSMSAMGITVKDLPKYLDMVAQASRRSNTDIDALMEAFMVTGGTLSSFGVPLEESTALLGVLANRGYKGAEAGTAMNAIFTNLTSGMGQAGKAMSELGISAFDTDGNFKGLEKVLMDVNDATKGMTDEQRAQYISMIAGKEHLKTFQALLGGLDEEYGDLKGSISDSDGALMDMATTMQDNLKGTITQLMSAVEEMAISIGSALIPIIREAAEGLKGLIDWFNGLNPAVSQTIAFIGLAAAGILGFITVLGLTMSVIGTALQGFGSLGLLISKMIPAVANAGGVFAFLKGAMAALLGPVGLVIGAIAGLIGIFVHLYKTNEGFRDAVQEAWTTITESIVTAATEIWDIITQVFGQIMEIIAPVIEHIKEDFTGAGEVITEVFGGAFTFISELIAAAIEFISEVIVTGLTAVQEFLAVHGETITELLIGAYEFIKSAIGAAIDFIWDIVTTVLTAVQDFWAAHGDTIISFATSAWETIKSIVDTVIKTVSRIVQKVLGHIQEFWSKHGDTVIGIVKWFMDFIKSDISGAIDFISNVIGAGLTFIKWLFETVWPLITGIVEVAWGLIEMFVQSGIDIVAGILDVAMSLIEGDWEGAWEAIKGIAENIWENIISFFENIDLYQIGADIIQGLVNGIGSMFGAVKKKVGELAALIPDGVKSFLGIKSPSRLMRDDVGKWIPEGLADGIEGSLSSVNKAVDQMSAIVPRQIDPPRMKPLEVARPNVRGSGGLTGVIERQDTATNAAQAQQGGGITLVYQGSGTREQADEFADWISERLSAQARMSDLYNGIR